MQLDRDWLLRFDALLDLMRRALWITAALLGAGVIAVVGNTIRLEIRSRAAEIEVTQLVGGSRAFVRRPFLYTGVLYGLIAGGARLGHRGAGARAGTAVRASLAWPRRMARASAFAGPSLARARVLLMLGGLLLGWIGAALASGREIAAHATRRLAANIMSIPDSVRASLLVVSMRVSTLAQRVLISLPWVLMAEYREWRIAE